MPKPPTIELIVRGVLLAENHLLICQNRTQGHCFLPGGHIEFGESARQALEREIQEELGIALQVKTFLGACESTFRQPSRKSTGKSPQSRLHHELNLLFALFPGNEISATSAPEILSALRALGLDPRKPEIASQEDHIAFRWIPLADLINPSHPACLLPPAILPLVLAFANHSSTATTDSSVYEFINTLFVSDYIK